MNNYTVYMHIAPNGKKYIGITYRDPTKRWGNCGYGYHKNEYFYRAITKYGWSNFAHVVLVSGISKEEAESIEVELIKKFRSNECEHGYNIEGGGNAQHSVNEETRKKISHALAGRKGAVRSEETCNKIRVALTGKGPSPETAAKISAALKGRHPTEEERRKMSMAHIGRIYTEERNRKISVALTGRVFSDDAKRRMSESQKERLNKEAKTDKTKNSNRSPLSDDTKQKIRDAHNKRVRDVECLTIDGEVVGRFTSLAEAEEKTGIKKPNIWCACSGKSKSAGGFWWRYV